MSEFGKRLRQARINKGMSQQDLSRAIGMTQASISQFEKGLRTPTPANLRKFAEILDMRDEDLVGETQGEFETKMLMRNIQDLSPNSLSKINEYAAMIRRDEQIKQRGIGVNSRQLTATYAARLRDDLGVGDNDIIGDIIDLVRKAGYQYIEDSFGDEFSGFSKALGGGQYLIGFNKDQYWSKSFHRFTISHELGHVTIPWHRRILEREGRHRSKSEFQSKQPIEREADYFAVCFLAPRKAFKLVMKHKEFTKESIFSISEHFEISAYATVLRFMELTDLACTLVVCNKEGIIEYERRSDRMKETYRQDFLKKKQVKDTTLTYDYINGRTKEESSIVPLSEWFDDLPDANEIQATESVIKLGYNNKFLTMLVPHIPDLEDYNAESEDFGF